MQLLISDSLNPEWFEPMIEIILINGIKVVESYSYPITTDMTIIDNTVNKLIKQYPQVKIVNELGFA